MASRALRPAPGPGVLTGGAHAANFIGLAAARQWCGEGKGVDVAEDGVAALGPVAVFATPRVHASVPKALAQLGLGRRALRIVEESELERALEQRDGVPAILVGSAGDVDTGSFDDLDAMAQLAERHGAWFHVDGAFGLFARTTPRAAGLADGAERADSIATDAHKWLEVPYDCGIAFVRDARILTRVHRLKAPYLPRGERATDGWRPPVLSNLDLGASRRGRALAVWSVLRARGRSGVRDVVEGCLDRASELTNQLRAAPDYELLAPTALNVVCFRARPEAVRHRDLDDVNERLAAELRRRGDVLLGLTRHGGRVALRAAFVSSRTGAAHVEELLAALDAAFGHVMGGAPYG